MNKNAVKAANLRAKYIIDKYQYGISCTKCSYKYKEYLIKDFRSFCYTDVCGDDLDLSDITNNKTLDCTLTSTEVTYETCQTSPEFIDCDIVYTGCRVNNFEDNDSMYTSIVTNNDTLYFNLSAIVVDSTSYVSTDRLIEINSTNINIQKINGNNIIMNLFDYINSLDIPGFYVYPTYIDKDYVIIEADGASTFSITTEANEEGDSLVRGVIITEEGLQSVQLTVGAAYTPVASLSSPESEVFIAGVNCSNYSKC